MQYVDPFNCKRDDMNVFLGKHHKYAYQNEYRCFWLPSHAPTVELEPMFLELGSMHQFAEFIVLE